MPRRLLGLQGRIVCRDRPFQLNPLGELTGTYADANGVFHGFLATPGVAPPTITSISPVSAIAGGPAFTLTVNGTNFISGSTVNFNGSALATKFASATQLTAVVPASGITLAGTFNVVDIRATRRRTPSASRS